MDSQILWVLGVILGIGLVCGVIILLVMPRGKQAETMVDAGNTFELQCAPADGKPYKLFARYGVTWSEGGRHGFGLTFDLIVMVDDEVIYDEKVGVGRTADDVNYAGGTEYFVSSGSGPGGYHRGATVKLIELGERSPGSTIIVTGKVIPAPGTEARPTKIYIAR